MRKREEKDRQPERQLEKQRQKGVDIKSNLEETVQMGGSEVEVASGFIFPAQKLG